MARVNITNLLETAFPTLDLTREEDVAALVSAIQTEPDKVNRVIRQALEQLRPGEREPE